MGLFCCLSGVARSAYIHGASDMRGDETWDKIPIQILFIIETTLAISGASMAVLKPLLAELGWIGETPVVSRGTDPSPPEPVLGNKFNNKRTTPSAFLRNIYHGVISGLSTFASSEGGGSNFDGADEGGDVHATTGHVQPTDIELGKLDESINEDSKESRRTSSTLGILRTCTIETRHERAGEHGLTESTASLAGPEVATGHESISPSHHEAEAGHGHKVNTSEKRMNSTSSSLNTEKQHAADLFAT